MAHDTLSWSLYLAADRLLSGKESVYKCLEIIPRFDAIQAGVNIINSSNLWKRKASGKVICLNLL